MYVEFRLELKEQIAVLLPYVLYFFAQSAPLLHCVFPSVANSISVRSYIRCRFSFP